MTKLVGCVASIVAAGICAIVFLLIVAQQFKSQFHTGGGYLPVTIVIGLVATIGVFGIGMIVTSRIAARKHKITMECPPRATDM